MRLRQFIKTLIVAALLVPLMGIAALATEASATTALNVRTGPGSGFTVVDTLTPGEVVDVTDCQPNGWCHITHPGPDGWVNSSYLTATPSAGSAGDDCSFQLTIGPAGPQFTIVCGDGPTPTLPSPTPVTDRACFYDGPNYTGQSFCRQVGVYNSLPSIANDRITSVQLFGNAKVRLCVKQNMGPFCRDVTGNEGHLGGFLNNQVSSLRVFTGALPPKKQVCLFDHPNYGGQHMCFGVGTETLPLGAQNKATSVRVMGGAGVRLCKHPTYCIGPAKNVLSNTPMLAPFWNNQTSSVRVY